MREFTIYSLSTGLIYRNGVCHDGDLEAQAGDGEGVLPDVRGNPATHKVDIEAEEPVLIPLPAPSLEQRKTTLLARLAERRWQIETGGISVAGVPIRTDRESQSLLSGAVNLSNLNPAISVKWKTAAGDFVDLNAAAIQGAALAVGQHIQLCFAREAELSTLIGGLDAGDLDTEGELDDWNSIIDFFWE